MNKTGSIYFERYAYYKKSLIKEPPSPDLGLVVTVPCYDEPDLTGSLKSLAQCSEPVCDVEVIVLINEPENASAEVSRKNANSYDDARKWTVNHSRARIRFHILYDKTLPERHAGVGLARKIAMDEACRRLVLAGADPGIITGFDADCRCEPDYLVETERLFMEHRLTGASFYFEHPLTGPEDPELYRGIAAYEYHLRYYVLGLRYAGFPYAFHTIGSSMAVEYKAYLKQGGMNLRKAGEDFYFLHKIFPLGRFREINTTRVMPSPRPSHRVPFGTGRSMMKWQEMAAKQYQTYHPDTFEDLKKFIKVVMGLYGPDHRNTGKWMNGLPGTILDFFGKEKMVNKISAIRSKSASPRTFQKNFFHWFNGLEILHFVHHARDHTYGIVPVTETGKWLAEKYNINSSAGKDVFQLLKAVRDYDRKNACFLRVQ